MGVKEDQCERENGTEHDEVWGDGGVFRLGVLLGLGIKWISWG